MSSVRPSSAVVAEPAPVVELDEVAGPVPTPDLATGARLEHDAAIVEVGAVPVTRHHGRRPDQQLARLAVGHRPVVGVEEEDDRLVLAQAAPRVECRAVGGVKVKLCVGELGERRQHEAESCRVERLDPKDLVLGRHNRRGIDGDGRGEGAA